MAQNCKGMQILRTEKKAVWKNEDIASGRLCAALSNLSDEEAVLSVMLDELVESPGEADGAEKMLYELWTKEESRTVSGRIEASVPAHGVRVYRVS